jgi:hypothetical protein
VPIDPGLLAILPEQVGGIAVQPAPEVAAGLAVDPGLVASTERLAAAVAIDPVTSEFAYATITVPRPGLFDEAFFRNWRESFDVGACSQAGGVDRDAQAEMAGRTVYIGTCAEGVRSYHVHLPEPDRIVSISSTGEKRLGEQLAGTLRP